MSGHPQSIKTVKMLTNYFQFVILVFVFSKTSILVASKATNSAPGTTAIYFRTATNFMTFCSFHIQCLETTTTTGKWRALPSCMTSSWFCSLFLGRCAQSCLDIRKAQAGVAKREGRVSVGFCKEDSVFRDKGLHLALAESAKFPCAVDFYLRFTVLTAEKLSRRDRSRSYFNLACMM